MSTQHSPKNRSPGRVRYASPKGDDVTCDRLLQAIRQRAGLTVLTGVGIEDKTGLSARVTECFKKQPEIVLLNDFFTDLDSFLHAVWVDSGLDPEFEQTLIRLRRCSATTVLLVDAPGEREMQVIRALATKSAIGNPDKRLLAILLSSPAETTEALAKDFGLEKSDLEWVEFGTARPKDAQAAHVDQPEKSSQRLIDSSKESVVDYLRFETSSAPTEIPESETIGFEDQTAEDEVTDTVEQVSAHAPSVKRGTSKWASTLVATAMVAVLLLGLWVAADDLDKGLLDSFRAKILRAVTGESEIPAHSELSDKGSQPGGSGGDQQKSDISHPLTAESVASDKKPDEMPVRQEPTAFPDRSTAVAEENIEDTGAVDDRMPETPMVTDYEQDMGEIRVKDLTIPERASRYSSLDTTTELAQKEGGSPTEIFDQGALETVNVLESGNQEIYVSHDELMQPVAVPPESLKRDRVDEIVVPDVDGEQGATPFAPPPDNADSQASGGRPEITGSTARAGSVESIEQEIDREFAQDSDTQERVSRLLQRAEVQLANQRLSRPAGDNALETYKEILLLAPDHAQAKKGITGIKETYEKWAMFAEKRGEFANAAEKYRRALQIDPNDRGILEKLKRVEAGKPAE